MSIGSITPQYILNGAKKFGSNYVKFVFGTENEEFSKHLADTIRGKKVNGARTGGAGVFNKNIGKNISNSWDAALAAKGNVSFWESTKATLKSIGPDFAAAAKTPGIWAKTKSIFGTIAKRMPLIGNLLVLGFEVPNIYRAFKDGGVGTGVGEVFKAAAKLGVFSIGMTVGTVFGGPLVGMAVGFGAGILADKIFGKSFTEKQEEAKAQTEMTKEQREQQAAAGMVAPQDNTRVATQAPKDMTQELLNMAGAGTNVNPAGYFKGNTGATSQNTTNPFTQGAYQMGMGNQVFPQSYMDQDFMSAGMFGNMNKTNQFNQIG